MAVVSEYVGLANSGSYYVYIFVAGGKGTKYVFNYVVYAVAVSGPPLILPIDGIPAVGASSADGTFYGLFGDVES